MEREIFSRTDEEKKRCQEIHDSFREEFYKRELSNSQQYDRAILTLSSAGFAISITAIKFVIPLETATNIGYLKTSWFLFFFTIMLSLVGFLIGNFAIRKQLEIAYDYYIVGYVDAETKKNWLSTLNRWLNYLTGLCFILAILLIVCFITSNI